MITKRSRKNSKAASYSLVRLIALLIVSAAFFSSVRVFAQLPPKPLIDQPVTINGDTVEYLTDEKKAVASGNVRVDYQGTVLVCEKLTVDMQTKDAVAEGSVYLSDANGVMRGEKVVYNFQTKKGFVVAAGFISFPYFGAAEKSEMISDKHFTTHKGWASTCSFDRPHYRLESRQMDIFPQDKIQIRGNSLRFWDTPVAYLPYYSHSLKDPQMHVQLSPGHSKDWGGYLLTATRYYINDDIQGRAYLDYRSELGFGEGLGTNYHDTAAGKGDVKLYYTQERPRHVQEDQPGEFQRYFARWRHSWEIDPATNLMAEYYDITDEKRQAFGTQYNVLKDYFPREYELDPQPLTYGLLTRSFGQSSANLLVQKRTNRWYSQVEKLPEAKYSLPGIQLGSTPFFFEDLTQAANFNKKLASPSPSYDDVSVNRFDTLNKLSMPFKAGLVDLTPYVAQRMTYYSEASSGDSFSPRAIFYTGAEASTRFFRVFDVVSDTAGLDIHGLRHVVTPAVRYEYNHDPSVSAQRLVQMDELDAIGQSNAAVLELSNKLQTKRSGASVDLANLIVSSSYAFYSTDGLTQEKSRSRLADILGKLELMPYSWLRFYSDATYDHEEDNFSSVNYDVNLSLASERSIRFGQRYQHKEGNQLTLGADWRLTPKWKFRLYERYELSHAPDIRKGAVLQEYGFSRDLHCWTVDFTYSYEKGYGGGVWCIFKLKAFPETALDFSHGYNSPQSGSQYYQSP